jgi:serine/threonine-protein kinase RsbW
VFDGTLSAGDLGTVRRRLAAWARDAGLDDDTVDAITLAGYEALANVVEHAYREAGRGKVEVHATRTGQVATVTVTDHGQWRRPKQDQGTRGHGLMLIKKLGNTADVTSTPTGTTIRMTWLLPSPAAG